MSVRVCVCVRVTGSIRTLSAELIGSNEFLCWGVGGGCLLGCAGLVLDRFSIEHLDKELH